MAEPEQILRILFLEDVEEDAELVERSLRSEGMIFTFHRVDSKTEFLKAIREQPYDVILSDHSLPQFNSSEALKLCRRAGIIVPFILVTGSVSDEFAITKLKQGADDYILKSNLSRLPTAIMNSVKQHRLQRERLEAELALRSQNAELIKINNELDSFVYSVSHDIKAPLRSLLGLLNISMLDKHPRHPVYNKYFKMMEDSVTKLDETLKEILEYSRNSRSEITLGQIDFNTLLSNSMSKMEYMDGYRKIKIDTLIIGDDKVFFTDEYRLSVVLENLLSNAIKYCDLGKEKPFLHISLVINDLEVEIKFQDNGIGIDRSLMPKIFNMFFRGTERSDGAGLGLYIVKETVDKLNGTITVSSTLGRGTDFKVLIPNLKGYTFNN